jgi:hypothetical protein
VAADVRSPDRPASRRYVNFAFAKGELALFCVPMKRLLFVVILLAGAAAVEAADTLKVGEFTFKPPAPWKVSETPRPMSQGGLILPGKDGGPDLEASFYHFGPGQGGSLQDNIKRYQGMFQADPPAKVEREEIDFGKRKATLVVITGVYTGSAFRPEPTPKPDHTLIAAVLPSERGDVYVRMVGPSASMLAAKPELKKVLASAAPGKDEG